MDTIYAEGCANFVGYYELIIYPGNYNNNLSFTIMQGHKMILVVPFNFTLTSNLVLMGV